VTELGQMSGEERGKSEANLINNLTGQIRAVYGPNKVGQRALEFPGTLQILHGK
jgi:hypothetical protein